MEWNEIHHCMHIHHPIHGNWFIKTFQIGRFKPIWFPFKTMNSMKFYSNNNKQKQTELNQTLLLQLNSISRERGRKRRKRRRKTIESHESIFTTVILSIIYYFRLEIARTLLCSLQFEHTKKVWLFPGTIASIVFSHL